MVVASEIAPISCIELNRTLDLLDQADVFLIVDALEDFGLALLFQEKGTEADVFLTADASEDFGLALLFQEKGTEVDVFLAFDEDFGLALLFQEVETELSTPRAFDASEDFGLALLFQEEKFVVLPGYLPPRAYRPRIVFKLKTV